MARPGGQARVIPANEYRRVRWRNGQGWTREIHGGRLHRDDGDAAASAAAAGDDWDYRLSIAEIEHDAEFSTFAGVDRELVLLSGNGLRLCFGDGEQIALHPPRDQHRFAGERALGGEPVDGPAHVFNLMWRRQRVIGKLWRRPLVGPMVIFADPHTTWVLHLVAGQARFADASGLPALASGDTAILAAGKDKLRHVLDGGGEALLIRIAPQ